MTIDLPQEPPQLYVIGLGVSIPKHITTEARECMGQCRRIFAIVQEPPSLWIGPCESGVPEVINLLKTYAENVLRKDNYDRAADTVLNALQNSTPIGYVTYGNPLVYDSVAQELVRQAKQLQINVKVVPGISSIDSLLCDLGVDMAPGIQICEASWLVAARIAPQTMYGMILLQIGAFGSLRTHYRVRPTPASLAGLVDYLKRFYPASHQVVLVRSGGTEQQSARITKLSIERICEADVEDILNASLYIPAVEEARIEESTLRRMLDL